MRSTPRKDEYGGEEIGLMRFLIYKENGSKVLTVVSLLLITIGIYLTIFIDTNKAPNLAYKLGFDYSLMIGLPAVSYIIDAVKRVSHYTFVCATSVISYSISLNLLPGIVLVNVPIVITSLVIMLTFHTYLNLMWTDYMIEDVLNGPYDSNSLNKIARLNVKTSVTFTISFIYVLLVSIYLSMSNLFGFSSIDKIYTIVAISICVLVQLLRIVTNKKIMSRVHDKLKVVV